MCFQMPIPSTSSTSLHPWHANWGLWKCVHKSPKQKAQNNRAFLFKLTFWVNLIKMKESAIKTVKHSKTVKLFLTTIQSVQDTTHNVAQTWPTCNLNQVGIVVTRSALLRRVLDVFFFLYIPYIVAVDFGLMFLLFPFPFCCCFFFFVILYLSLCGQQEQQKQKQLYDVYIHILMCWPASDSFFRILKLVKRAATDLKPSSSGKNQNRQKG